MTDINALKDLVQEVDTSNICVSKELKRKTYRVDIINRARKKNRWGVATAIKYLYVGDAVTSKRDPRLIDVAISRLSHKQGVKLGLTKDQLKRLTFKGEWRSSSMYYEADSRVLHMAPDELAVQQALGIKDPTPISITIINHS